MTHAFHQTKFRWTENLTSRFIQLRKENGNLFTGRKYSAQAGWEHILQQMRQEFPTIMADVHYRVLKKKWSNLLQQYKELKNPVHGDKNKSDDVSWPFYGAIDEVLGYGQRNIEDDDDLNPHEFLCLSVTPEEPGFSPEEERRLDSLSDADHEIRSSAAVTAIKRIRNFNHDFSIEIERLPRVGIHRSLRPPSRPSQISQEELRRRNASEVLVSRLPPATELSIKTVRSSSASTVPGLRVRKFSNTKEEDDSPRQFLREALAVNSKINGNHTVCNYNELDEEEEDEENEEQEDEIEEEEEEEEEVGEELDDEDEEKERPRKRLKRLETPSGINSPESKLEKRLIEFMEYTKRRDEENRIIMTRILNAVERIAEKD